MLPMLPILLADSVGWYAPSRACRMPLWAWTCGSLSGRGTDGVRADGSEEGVAARLLPPLTDRPMNASPASNFGRCIVRPFREPRIGDGPGPSYPTGVTGMDTLALDADDVESSVSSRSWM